MKTTVSVRKPGVSDYVIFYLGLPAGLALVFAAVGIRLTVGMPFIDSVFYMVCHVMAAWLGIDFASRVIRRLFRSWRPPASVNIVVGFALALMPLAFYYQWLGGVFGEYYPSLAEARQDEHLQSWSLGYLLHFIRFSLPGLLLFMVGAFGFRYVTGVDWYGYAARSTAKSTVATEGIDSFREPEARLLENSKLPSDAVLHALKAEEHYVKVWSDKGKDMLRCRFQDAVEELEGYKGMRVHRSWWVNLDQVETCAKKGRSLELRLKDGAQVPVSLAYKQAVINSLGNGGNRPV